MNALSEIQLPTVDLPKVEVPAFDLPNVDPRATVSAAAEAIGVRQPARRSRWLMAAGALIVAAAAGWGVMRSPQIRARSQQFLRSVRERISAMRPNAFDLDVGDPADPIAFPAAETKPISPDRWNDIEDSGTPDYPEGLGADTGDPESSREASKSGV